MQNKVRPLDKGIRNTGKILNAIGMGMLAVMMFLGAGDVIGRYVFNRPISGAMEVSSILLAGIVLLGWAHTQATDGHVRVELVLSRFSPRVRAIINSVTLFLSLVLFSLIVWQGAMTAISHWESQRLMPVIMVPIAPFELLVPLGALVLCLVLIIQLICTISKIRGEN